MLDMNCIKNCPVIGKDITIVHNIFGKDKDTIKGNSRKPKPIAVRVNEIDLPTEFTKIQDLQPFINVMFVNGMEFLVSIDNPICHRVTS